MPRPRGDHAARRRDVSAAVWRVLAARGFAGLTMRAVADELGATTGVVTHYFTGKRELLEHALGLLDDEVRDRRRTVAEPGLPSVRAALLDLLPRDEDARSTTRIWVSSWDAAVGDPELARAHAERYAAGRVRLATLVAEAQRLGHLPDEASGTSADDVAASLHAFVLGVCVQAVLDPVRFPARRQEAMVEEQLARLEHPGPARG